MKRIVILNNGTEAADYGQNHRQSGDIVLPIGPGARHYAVQKGWEIRALKSFWENKDYYKAKAESEQRVNTLVKELNEYSKSVAKNFPVEIGNYFHNQLLIVIGSIHYNFFILNSIQKKINPTDWMLYVQKNEPYYRDFFPSSSMQIKQLFNTSQFIQSKNIIDSPPVNRVKQNIHVLRGKSHHRRGRNIKQIIKSYLPVWMKDIIIRVWDFAKAGSVFTFSKKKLLMLGTSYDWEPVLQDERFRSRYYIKIERGDQVTPTDEPTDDLLNILKHSVAYSSVPIYDLMVQARALQGAIKYFDKHYEKLEKRLINIEGILTSVLPFPMGNYIAHVAVTMKKPLILWEHGEHIAATDLFLKSSEIQYCTHYLTYGKNVKKRLTRYIGEMSYLNEVIQVGSTKKNTIRNNSVLVLYATGKWFFTRIPFIPPIDPDTRLYNAQKDIISGLEEIGKKHKVILKANNTPDFNEIPFKIKNIVINYYTPFVEYLKNACLVILDSPGTTLLEALSTDVPIFVLSGRDSSWDVSTTELLKKRAVVVDNTAELMHHVKGYLHNGTYAADLNDTEFLEAYGSTYGIEEVKERALKVIDDAIVKCNI